MIYIWVQSEGGGGVGGGRGRSDFFGPPLQKITGPLLRNFEYVIGIFSSSPVDWHPFRANWVKGGDCGHGLKSEARALGAGRGVSQANEAAIYPKLTGLCQHEIVSGILKKRSNEEPCKPVPGESFGHGRPYLSICPIPLRHFRSRS